MLWFFFQQSSSISLLTPSKIVFHKDLHVMISEIVN